MSKEINILDLVCLVKGHLIGNPSEDMILNGTCGLDDYVPHKVSFVKNEKYGRMLELLEGAVILIDNNLTHLCQIYPNNYYIVVRDAVKSIMDLQEFFYKDQNRFTETGISETAIIHRSAVIAKNVFVGENVMIGPKVIIGDRTKVMTNTVLMGNVRIGKGTIIYPGVTIHWNCQIGNDVVIHSGSCIGNQGSRYEQTDKTIRKMLQVGKVTIGDRVEIGCNSVINRATFEDNATVISEDVKIGDLVNIAHNVKIGARTLVVASSTIAGSTRIGEDVWIGAGASISNGLTIGNGAKILLNAVVAYDVAENEIVSGFYAMPHRQWKKVYQKLKECGKDI